MRGRMDQYLTADIFSGTPGAIAPADGNYAAGVAPGYRSASPSLDEDAAVDPYDLNTFGGERRGGANASTVGAQHAAPLPGTPVNAASRLDRGPNNERLEDLKPELVNALRELVRQYRQEGIVARRHEIRRIRQARLFWQGLQYAWWNPTYMNWHLPFEQRFRDDRELEERPRYQFATNSYQGLG